MSAEREPEPSDGRHGPQEGLQGADVGPGGATVGVAGPGGGEKPVAAQRNSRPFTEEPSCSPPQVVLAHSHPFLETRNV